MFASDSAQLVAPTTSPPARGAAPDALLAAVGETPLVPLRRLAESLGHRSEIWGKLELRNPSGSVKDRAALAIVRAALDDGRLGRGQTLVDASSGNTGLAYAWIGARLGFPVRLFLPRNASPARLRAIAAHGAEVVLTDPAEGTDGAQREARALAEGTPSRYFFADQYNNPANPAAHYAGTGPEIWRDSAGRLTHFVAGIGTGGTISGAGRYLKERRPGLRVIGVEPTGPLHGLEGLKHLPTAVRPGTYDGRVVDATIRVETEEAIAMAAQVARLEGIRIGRSAGAALVAAGRVGAAEAGAVVVAVLPDAGERGAEDSP